MAETKEYSVLVQGTVGGTIIVGATSEEEAIKKAEKEFWDEFDTDSIHLDFSTEEVK